MKKLHIIKIGGNVIDNQKQLETFLKNFSAIPNPKILIHGGGNLASELANKLGIKQAIVEGRRVTDAETLKVTIMVYAGLVNKTVVAKLQAQQCNAMGFCGADGNLIRSKKRTHSAVDFGYVGDILPNGIDVNLFEFLLNKGIVPIISPITHDGNGNLLNTNADTLASKIATALIGLYDVKLFFCLEKNGVLMDVENDESYIPYLNKSEYQKLKSDGIISKGMIPKLDNAFEAIEKGISRVIICHAQHIATLKTQLKGTQIIN